MTLVLTYAQNFWNELQAGLLPALGVWNYALLSFFVLVEGPIATLLGAAAASAGYMRVGLVFAAAAAGNMTADILWYSLGRMGKIEGLLRFGRWIGLRRSHLDHLKEAMVDHGPKLLLFAKLSSGFIIPSLIAAGLARLPLRRWLPVIALGESIWTGTLVLVGYYTTEAIKRVEQVVAFVIGAASIVFLLVLLWGIRHILKKSKEYNEVIGSDEQ